MSVVATENYRVHAGPHTIFVKITNLELKTHSGTRAIAASDYGTRTIWISAKVPPETRIEKLAHELYHFHEFFMGAPRGEEERARRHELVFAQVRRDVARNGGEEALRALTPA